MMTTVRALGSCVKTLAVGVTVAWLGLTVWPVTGRLGVTRAAGLPGAASDTHLVAQGERLFALDFTPERGLGPLLNGTSCLTCHNTPSAGGMGVNGLATVLRVGRLHQTGFDPLVGQGGPMVRAHSVAELGQPCGLALGIPAGVNLTSIRNTPPLFGSGLIDALASCQPLSATPCWPSYSRCRETRICTEGKENAVRTQTIILSLPGNGYVWLTQHTPGIALATLVGLSAWALQRLEVWLMGQAVLEAMVFALLLGMLWRNLVGVCPLYRPGIVFTGKQILEGTVVLLGASIDLPILLKAGPQLLLAIVVVVLVGMTASTLIGRWLGLPAKLATLLAVGSAICGNAAMAAVAPVIDAKAEDVASAIAITAVLGAGVVLLFPLLIPVFGFTFYQYGVLAGLTIYAVPQVLAATVPVSVISSQIGTLVKLVRVLLLGPIIVVFSLTYRPVGGTRHLTIRQFVPWFIAGFIVLAMARSVGILPSLVAESSREVSRWGTTAAMAALGLEVQFQTIRRVVAAVAITVVLSLLVLVLLSIMLLQGLRIA